MSDINVTMLAFQILNIVLLIAWIVLVVYALRQLRGAQLSESLRLGWTLIIHRLYASVERPPRTVTAYGVSVLSTSALCWSADKM